MERKSEEDIAIFIRDEQSRRVVFNAKALQALGIDPMEAQQRGYCIKEQSETAKEPGAG
jgi:PAS domain-containing protein